MKTLAKISLAATLTFSLLNAAQYAPDSAHSNVGFSVKHLKIAEIHGAFTGYSATIDYDKANNELKAFEANIDAASIDTRVQKRDEHLKNADFFDVSKFPTLKFKMTKFQKDSKDEGKIHGDLTIKDVTKPVVLDFKFNGDSKNMSGKEVVGFEIDGEILRSEFGVGEKFPHHAISDKVELNIDIEAILK